MRKTELDKYRKLLETRRSRIVGTVRGMRAEATDSEGTPTKDNAADHASVEYDQDVNLSLLANEQEALSDVDSALGRIEDGNYGVCDECKEKIAKARLDALPTARYCVDCQEAHDEGRLTDADLA